VTACIVEADKVGLLSNDEMTKKGHQEFWLENGNFGLKKETLAK